MKPVLNDPDAFDKWVKDEEIEFKEPPVQKDMKRESTSQSVSYYVRLIMFYLMLYYFPPPVKTVTFIFPSKMVFWGYSKIP